MIYVYPYKKYSKSARLLARKLGGKLIRLKNSKFKWNKPVINWGNSNVPGKALNLNVKPALNKLVAFRRFKENDIRCPDWTEDHATAIQWAADGHVVFARTRLMGHSGQGIVVLNEFPDTNARLYTKYVKKKGEFRLHVIGNSVVDVQEKRKRNGGDHSLVRSHQNGYVYCREDVTVPEDAPDLAIRAVRALGLDFGAVDVIWNQKKGVSYCLEVNTAPGISETTAHIYARELLK